MLNNGPIPKNHSARKANVDTLLSRDHLNHRPGWSMTLATISPDTILNLVMILVDTIENTDDPNHVPHDVAAFEAGKPASMIEV